MDSERVRGVIAVIAFLGASFNAAMAEEKRPVVRMLVQSSPLAGFQYHQANEVWQRLRVGDPLDLAREPENSHDAMAVRVSWRGHMLGYVPRRENATLAWALDRGKMLRVPA